MARAVLEENDYVLLDYINRNEPIEKDKLIAKFSEQIDSVEYRIQLLEEPDYEMDDPLFKIAIKNSSFIISDYDVYTKPSGTTLHRDLGIYRLTALGKKSLQDYKKAERKAARRLWLENCWIPIIVSVATNLVIAVLKLLLPLIQQWVSKTP